MQKVLLAYIDSRLNVHLYSEPKLQNFEELQKYLKLQTFLIFAPGRVLFALRDKSYVY